MFCKNCGKEIADNAQFCKFCGKENIAAASSGGNIDSDCVKIDSSEFGGTTIEEHTTLNDSEDRNKGRLIMKIAAVIVIACFFFPMFTVSCAGIDVMDVSLVNIFAGIDNTDETEYYEDYEYDSDEEDEEVGADGMIVYLVAPVIAFALCMKKKSKKVSEQDIAAIFIASALSLIVQYAYMTAQIADVYEYIKIKPLFTYYLYIIACAIGAICGIRTAQKKQTMCINDEQISKHIKMTLLIKTILMSLGGTFAMVAIYYLLNDI